MKTKEIITYFASKNLGSVMFNLVDLVWEQLDEIEKQMACSLRKKGACQISIRSKLPQKQLEIEMGKTKLIDLID